MNLSGGRLHYFKRQKHLGERIRGEKHKTESGGRGPQILHLENVETR